MSKSADDKNSRFAEARRSHEREITIIAATLLATLEELPSDYAAPEGILYVPFMAYGLDVFQEAAHLMLKRGLLKRRSGHCYSITDEGISLARQMNDITKGRGAENGN